MFIGDFEKAVPWSYNGIKGCRRFLDRVWRLQDMVVPGDDYSDDMQVSMQNDKEGKRGFRVHEIQRR